MTKKRVKNAKVPSSPMYNLMTLQEVKELEQHYTNRMQELRSNAIQFFSEALHECSKIDAEQHKLDAWNAYVNCDTIPKPYLTPDIRKFLTKQNYDENRRTTVNIDWLLSVDERSILTQNIYRVDATRETLVRTSKPDFGQDYEQFIDDALNLIKRIEYFLCDPPEKSKIAHIRMEDIVSMKPLLYEKIKDIFNCYTYRILCNEDAYMNSIDAISSEYTYTSKNFKIHIWSLKNVPIRFTHMTEPRMIADLHNLRVILNIPVSMLRLELTIQGIHMNFDIFSEYVTMLKSRETNISSIYLNNNVPNLSDCLFNEWTLIREIQERVRERIVQLRENYEERVKLIQEAQAKEAKMAQRDIAKKRASQLKLPTVAPQSIGPDEYPDVYVDFVKEENERYRKYIDENYNPHNFNLLDDELNLKKYVILGGVYQLYCVQKPKHYDFRCDRFNMTTHSPQRNLIVETDFCIKVEPPKEKRSTEFSVLTTESITIKRLSGDEIDPNNPWFVLVFYLPKDLCLWTQPIACHFETIEVELQEPIPKLISPTSVTKRAAKSKNVAMFSKDNELILTQSKQTAMNTFKDIHSQYCASQNTIHSLYSQHGWGEEIGRFTPNVNDFALNGTYDIHQTALMKRFCAPQIISSYKFQREINEEVLRHEQGKPKGKGGILISKPRIKIVETTNKIFSYDAKQSNPERVFPVYMRTQTFNTQHRLDSYDDVLPHEPKTFYQLSRVLTLIKNKFKERPHNIINLPDFQMPLIDKTERKYKKIKMHNTLETPIDISHSSSFHPLTGHGARKSTKPTSNYRLSTKVSKTIRTSNLSIEHPVTHSRSYRSSRGKRYSDSDIKEETEKQTVMCTKWTTRHIRNFHFVKDECKYIIETDRLGCIGFAFKRYIHFPFKYWELQPSETDPQNEVVFTLETQFVKCVLKVTGEGISGYVTDVGKKYVRNPKMYLVIDQPMRDYTEFKKRFKENNINIFADDDASFYIENGNFSEKHLPLEFHTYSCMAINCNQVKFNHSLWNCLAQRRDIILEFVGYSDNVDSKVLVRLTPEQATFVEITELCTMDLHIIELEYKPTWRNIGFYCDLHQMICSMYPGANDYRCKNAKLICFLNELLREIRPFSFS